MRGARRPRQRRLAVRREAAGSWQFAEKLQAAGREAVGFRCDVSDAQSCKDLVDFTLKTYGTIDILDCNAGICTLSDFLITSDDAWRDAHIDINIKGKLYNRNSDGN